MNGSIKIFVIIIVVFQTFGFFSCRKKIYSVDDCTTYDYADCNTSEPTHATITAKVTINSYNAFVPLIVFKGYIDQKDTFLLDTARTSKHELSLPVGVYYSVLAKYKTSDKTIYAVDGGFVDKYKQKVCDSTCWNSDNKKLNLYLKY